MLPWCTLGLHMLFGFQHWMQRRYDESIVLKRIHQWSQMVPGRMDSGFFFFKFSTALNVINVVWVLLKSVYFTVWVLLKSLSFLSYCTGSMECARARSVSNNVFIKPLYRQKSKLIARLTCHLALWTSYWTLTYEWKLKRLISNLLHERNAKVKWKYIYIPVVVAIKADLEFQFSFCGNLN